jgi:hypothetical protein
LLLARAGLGDRAGCWSWLRPLSSDLFGQAVPERDPAEVSAGAARREAAPAFDHRNIDTCLGQPAGGHRPPNPLPITTAS